MDRKTIAYYMVSTYYIQLVNTMPFLALVGPSATGKSTVLDIAHNYCYRPYRIQVGSRTTFAALSGELVSAHNITAVMDEADRESGDIEPLLRDRFSRSTAIYTKNVRQEKEWDLESFVFFGATVLACRNKFQDVSVESRGIIINTYGGSRPPMKLSDPTLEGMLAGFRSGASGLELPPMPTGDIPGLEGVDGRIVDAYSHILNLAHQEGDEVYLELLRDRLHKDSELLDEGRTYDSNGLILNSILAAASTESDVLFFNKGISLVDDIAKPIWRDHGVNIPSRTISRCVKEMKLEVRKSHGVNKLYVEDVIQFTKTCLRYGLGDDEAIVATKLFYDIDEST